MPDETEKLRAMVAVLERENRLLSAWRDRVDRFLDFGRKIARAWDFNALLQLLADETRDILGADRCTLFLCDPKTSTLWSRIAHGIDAGQEIRIPIHMGLAGHVCKTGEVLNIPDAYQDSRFNPAVDHRTGYRTKSVLVLPMRDSKRQVLGVFQVINKKPVATAVFDNTDEEILGILSRQAASAIETAALMQELRKSYEETIFRLALAAEYKDKDTGQHLKRMSEYSAILARALGLPSEKAEVIRLAAPMHDIGKIGVPEQILNKPGPLTPPERAEMQKHPLYGGRILSGSDSDLLLMSEKIALHHHERWDGKGYPQGLRGDQISLEGRICALADVFDALTSKRAYKPAWSLEKTVDTIREGRGSQFDPDAADAFLSSFEQAKEVMERFTDRPPEKPMEPPAR